MMWSDGGWGAGDWMAMSLMMFVVWGGLIALVVWLAGRFRDNPPHTSGSRPTAPDADQVLAERFARGEIDADEFTRRRELLHAGGRGSAGNRADSRRNRPDVGA